MKKIKYLLVVLLGILVLPMCVNADVKADKEIAKDSKEVKVYFFRGEGCSHCAEAEEWFASIEEKLGDKFEVIGYETWQNEDNSALMDLISEARNDGAEGVPYIIVGDQSWNGFDTSYEEAIEKAIEDEYAKEVKDRRDVVQEALSGKYKVETKQPSTDTTTVIILVVIIVLGAAGAGVYYYLNNKKETVEIVKKVPEEKKKTTTKKKTNKK